MSRSKHDVLGYCPLLDLTGRARRGGFPVKVRVQTKLAGTPGLDPVAFQALGMGSIPNVSTNTDNLLLRL